MQLVYNVADDEGSMYKVMKTFICRGCVIPVTGTRCKSGALIRPVDISYTGLEADVAVTCNISLTISGWLLALVSNDDV